jgi:hypothetical protein
LRGLHQSGSLAEINITFPWRKKPLPALYSRII